MCAADGGRRKTAQAEADVQLELGKERTRATNSHISVALDCFQHSNKAGRK